MGTQQLNVAPLFWWGGWALIAYDYFGPKGAGAVLVLGWIATMAIEL
jgi:hypothetical protein